MQDPILEALTFSLDSELNVEGGHRVGLNNSRIKSAGSSGSGGGGAVTITTSSESLLNLNVRIPCMIPGCSFISDVVKEGTKVKDSNLLEHLLCVHHFVIEHVEQIANLVRYFSYWRDKLQGGKIEDYCFAMLMEKPIIYEDVKKGSDFGKLQAEQQGGLPSNSLSEGATASSKSDDNRFFWLTPILPEDNELRQKLWNERLELVLEMNRLEREQVDFSRQCLFCKDVCTGNRVNLFQHMAESHNFHIGQADNVVFVKELLDYICEKLNESECIYCGKVFKDKTVLREHMRKKQHKRINPSNGDYDKFYIVNYLEPGKTWKILDEEDPEDDRREEEWMETKDEETSIVCLLCSFQNSSFDTILSHMLSEHQFDFKSLTCALTFYQKVKIVNFVRRNIHQNVCLFCEKKFFERVSLLGHLHEHGVSNTGQAQPFPDSKTWDRAEYFFPTYENDQFLILLDREGSEELSAHTPEGAESMEASTLVIPEDLPVVRENQFLKNEFARS